MTTCFLNAAQATPMVDGTARSGVALVLPRAAHLSAGCGSAAPYGHRSAPGGGVLPARRRVEQGAPAVSDTSRRWRGAPAGTARMNRQPLVQALPACECFLSTKPVSPMVRTPLRTAPAALR